MELIDLTVNKKILKLPDRCSGSKTGENGHRHIGYPAKSRNTLCSNPDYNPAEEGKHG